MLTKNRKALTLVMGLIVAAFGATPVLAQTLPPTSGVLYDIDFNAETIGSPPSIHEPGSAAPRVQPSTVFGQGLNGSSIRVVATHGALTDKPLEFNVVGPSDTDGILLNMDDFPGGVPTTGFFVLQGEVFVDSGAGFNTALSIRFSNNATPLLNFLALNFGDEGSVVTQRGGSVLHSAPFLFDTKISFRMEVNLGTDTYRVLLDGVLFDSGSFQVGDTTGGIQRIAISVGSGIDGGAMTAAIDNVLVTAAFGPTPPAALLECSLTGAALAEFNNQCAAAGNGVLFVMDPQRAGSGTAGCLCPGVVSFVCVDGSANPCVGDPNIRLSEVSEASLRRGQMGFNTHQSFTYCFGNGGDRECRIYYYPH